MCAMKVDDCWCVVYKRVGVPIGWRSTIGGRANTSQHRSGMDESPLLNVFTFIWNLCTHGSIILLHGKWFAVLPIIMNYDKKYMNKHNSISIVILLCGSQISIILTSAYGLIINHIENIYAILNYVSTSILMQLICLTFGFLGLDFFLSLTQFFFIQINAAKYVCFK